MATLGTQYQQVLQAKEDLIRQLNRLSELASKACCHDVSQVTDKATYDIIKNLTYNLEKIEEALTR